MGGTGGGKERRAGCGQSSRTEKQECRTGAGAGAGAPGAVRQASPCKWHPLAGWMRPTILGLVRGTCVSAGVFVRACAPCPLPPARYDPYVQARSRVDQLRRLGHSVDKVRGYAAVHCPALP